MCAWILTGQREHTAKQSSLIPTTQLPIIIWATCSNAVRRDYDGAETAYRKAIELEPGNALSGLPAHWNLSTILESKETLMGQSKPSKATFEQAIQMEMASNV